MTYNGWYVIKTKTKPNQPTNQTKLMFGRHQGLFSFELTVCVFILF